uniref:Septum formation protein Maf n=1 Tax=Pyramimonas obovata TaxID=1411642 RepID=A0A7S0RUK1_9CHLO|mmetsp:Transcript_7195/g.14616  ORF Transcript_7195/g.14616 Transcript_7195/m.14616 type:complete len:222 (+) Transcript_7195:156-821(+)|eukprot:CAMPEP_0118930842 /NCGR_PEP_ID=MMETSP1169-20130426/7393_1 /TAXON_ID=36882 /ORGANISM="Pyramimonas obovata, Strain CCMP722" /LENGTH=221 /DNA_ID=CAMNT_0006873257 /DNA_START=129 /DNA_END=794 /DNA_ORIENTATION=-
MLIPYVKKLASKKLVLASASPRRAELLTNLGLKFDVVVSTFEETLDKASFPNAADYAKETATHKAIDVTGKVIRESGEPDMVIASDTIVELNGQILEKPDGHDGAYKMLSGLSGSKHKVHTGVVLILPKAVDPSTGKSPLVYSFTETTLVEFATLSHEAIEGYIASGEPMDKAGAYGIQGIGGSFVKGIQGCYFSVMGFPIHRFSAEVVRLIENGSLPLED